MCTDLDAAISFFTAPIQASQLDPPPLITHYLSPQHEPMCLRPGAFQASVKDVLLLYYSDHSLVTIFEH